MAKPRSPVPQEVSAELGRLAERWHQLPLGEALWRVPQVRAVVESLAGEAVPDLGPAVLMDQLTVMVHDGGRDAAVTERAGTEFAEQLAERLAGLRRAL